MNSNLKSSITTVSRLLAGAVCALTLCAHSANAIGTKPTTQILFSGNTATWYTGGSASNMTKEVSSLVFNNSTPGQASALAYFSPTTLQIGQSMQLSFTYLFTNTNNADNSLMFGLFDSNGVKTSSNGTGLNNSTFTNYTGYAASGVEGTGIDHVEVRNVGGNDLLSLGSYTEGHTYQQPSDATTGQFYQASITLSRTAAGITETTSIGGNTITQDYTSATGLYPTLDTVAISSNGSTGEFIINTVAVTEFPTASMAPEPAPVMGMALLGLAIAGCPLGRKFKGVLAQFATR